MTMFANNLSAALATSLLDLHGEAVEYTPAGGTVRTIKAMIDRNAPIVPGGLGSGPVDNATLIVRNAATASSDDGYGGIASQTVNTGGDEVGLRMRVNAAITRHRIVQVEAMQGGMLRVVVQ